MKRNPILTVFWILVICLSASATIINIPDDYETIQEGIDASTDGDTVLVQPEIYVENINFTGHNITLGSLFLTTGDTTYIEQTIIDCSNCWNTVTFANGEDENAAIIGFSILSTPWYDYNRGIYCEDSSPVIRNNIISGSYIYEPGAGISLRGNSNATILNNTITNNSSTESRGGAGIACMDESSPQIIGNIIFDNISDPGGGILCADSSSPHIINNTITENLAGGTGGGIYCCSSNEVIIRNNIISSNRSLMSGGGISCISSSPVIAGNIIRNNIALDLYESDNHGGGIYCSNDSAVLRNNLVRNNQSTYGGGICCVYSNSKFENNCIVNNTADSLGGAIFCKIGSNPNIVNSIIWGNYSPQNSFIYLADSSVITVTYSDIPGGWEGEGNINAIPHFRHPEDGDFHLKSTACGDPYDSPCIDVGHPDIIDSLLDCSWGLGTILSDMGAYGGGDSATVDIIDQEPWIPDRFALLQNYPNPFNKSTTIIFSVPEAQLVIITVYDILGREMQTLLDEYRQAGVHRITFHASDLPSGIYFYRLHTGELDKSRRMILMK